MFSSLKGNTFVRKMTAKSGRKKEERDEMERRSSIRQSTLPFLTFLIRVLFSHQLAVPGFYACRTWSPFDFSRKREAYVREHVWIRKISSWHPFAV